MSDAGGFVREGRAWVFGDRIAVESISPLKYMFSPQGRAEHCLEAIDPDFGSRVEDGDLLVAGHLFGHGPGHDHANLALKEAGIGGVVARSIAPQFLRHSIDHGLLVAECPEILEIASPGGRLRVDFGEGLVENLDSGARAAAVVPTGPAREIVELGGLLPYLRRELASQSAGSLP